MSIVHKEEQVDLPGFIWKFDINSSLEHAGV